MALEIRDIRFSRRPEVHRFLVESAEVITKGELVGIHDGTGSGTKGEVEDYNDGVDGLRFLGVNVGDTVTGDGSTVYCAVDISGMYVRQCTVTGSASSQPLTPVFALKADPLDGLTITAPDSETAPVGVLIEQLDGSTGWAVLLRPGTALLDSLAALTERAPDTITLFDDFLHYVSGDNFSTIATDSGTAADSDAVGGVVVLTPSDGTVADNDEVYLATTQECFKFAAGKKLYFEARVAVTEANTDDANVLVGLMDGVAANAIQDDGAGPKASYSGAVFYKVDGGTTWQAEVSIGGTQTAVTLSPNTFPGDGTYQKLGIEFLPGTATTDGTVNFYIDEDLAGTTSSFDYSSATEMDAVVGLKNGSANNESASVDLIYVKQDR